MGSFLATTAHDDWRDAIEAALPGQLSTRAKDAAIHKSRSRREALRLASTFAAENKWRRDGRIWS